VDIAFRATSDPLSLPLKPGNGFVIVPTSPLARRNSFFAPFLPRLASTKVTHPPRHSRFRSPILAFLLPAHDVIFPGIALGRRPPIDSDSELCGQTEFPFLRYLMRRMNSFAAPPAGLSQSVRLVCITPSHLTPRCVVEVLCFLSPLPRRPE